MFGVFVIVLGAHLLIDSTIFIANMMNISELIISIIVIAIGTSLPEIATVVAAAIKRMEGIAIGAAVGSNIFNLTALALASLATPIHVTRSLVLFSIPLMILVSVLLLVTLRTGWKLKRREGILFLIVYAVFIYMQFIVW